MIDRARFVFAEVSDQVPEIGGCCTLSRDEIDVIVHTSRPPPEHPAAAPKDVETAIPARSDHVGPDAVPPVLARDRPGQRDQVDLRGTVDTLANRAEGGIAGDSAADVRGTSGDDDTRAPVPKAI